VSIVVGKMLFLPVSISAGYNHEGDAAAVRIWQPGSISGRDWRSCFLRHKESVEEK